MTYFLSGGSKSGKSMLAQNIAKSLPAPHYYLATLRPTDEEDRAIVRRHLQERDGWGFETIECESGILSALTLAPQNGTFLLDSVTALLANEMFRADGSVISVTGSMIERIKKLLIKNIDAMKMSPAVSAMRPIMSTCRSTFLSPVT